SQDLVEGFLDFWRRNDAILRVVDLGAAEGDKRFYKIRMKILNSVNNSLTDSVKELQDKGKVDKDVSPAAMAGSLVAMLAAVASHQRGFQTWGVKQAELKPNLAQLVHLGVTGKKPTK
ncbi:TetR/AcrR family transcriptional regulator, partial [Streptomyces sp. NPDC005918]